LNGEGSGRTCPGAIAAASPFFAPFNRALSLALDFHHVLGSRFGQEWQVLRSRFSAEWQILRPLFYQVLGPRFGQDWRVLDPHRISFGKFQNSVNHVFIALNFETSFWPRMDRFGTSLLYKFGDLDFYFFQNLANLGHFLPEKSFT
jgi:hypothetical protein